MTPTWTVLIATLGQRGDRFQRLLSQLLPQVEAAAGAVTVEALWNNGERPLCEVRQDLITHARSTYTSFIDDDDEIPDYYVSKVLPLLDGEVDYIGWRMQCWVNGQSLLPTFHSLKYSDWYSDANGHYRDISHLNPVKRSLAIQHANFCVGNGPEDYSWVLQLRGHLQTEKYIDEVMYFYRSDTNDSTWRGITPVDPASYNRPSVRNCFFTYHPRSSN